MNSLLRIPLPLALSTCCLFGGASGLSAQSLSFPIGSGSPLLSPFTLSITGVLTIHGTPSNDVVTVTYGSTGYVTVKRGTATRSYLLSAVEKVRCQAGGGSDSLSNYTSIPCEFDGGDGNDYLLGGSGPDRLVGGSGHDTIHGGSGRDDIFGGSGNDTVYGNSGQDLIVTVGGGTDSVYGGSQWDNFWVDTSDTIHDSSTNEHQLGYVHTIGNFELLQAPTYTYQPSLEPNGVNIPDPLPLTGHAVMLQNQSHRALFGPNGPDENDINQGDVGNCYFMAMLSAIACKQPEHIRKMVTSLGDGTYAVRLYRNGQPRYVRVDGDVWVKSNGQFAYARPGTSQAVWGPIVEKAFAFFRKEAGTFASIAGGNTSWEHHTLQVGATATDWALAEEPTKEAIIAWDQAGRSNLYTSVALLMQSRQLLEWIDQNLQAGRPVSTGARSGVSSTMAITANNYRRGQHVYHVYNVARDGMGNPYALILRDPYGSIRVVSDYARIVFLVGRATALSF